MTKKKETVVSKVKLPELHRWVKISYWDYHRLCTLVGQTYKSQEKDMIILKHFSDFGEKIELIDIKRIKAWEYLFDNKKGDILNV